MPTWVGRINARVTVKERHVFKQVQWTRGYARLDILSQPLQNLMHLSTNPGHLSKNPAHLSAKTCFIVPATSLSIWRFPSFCCLSEWLANGQPLASVSEPAFRFKMFVIAAADPSIWHGLRLFRTRRPIPRTAGAKTRPSGRAALRIAATKCRSAFKGASLSVLNSDPLPDGRTVGGEPHPGQPAGWPGCGSPPTVAQNFLNYIFKYQFANEGAINHLKHWHDLPKI